ncbi:glycosyltransferase family 4 protein [Actinoalloteichus caeruleus]|uniref:glycosyltransferase family 4 protein n=1 Tax=Actinoalloteichus cyanogriseus TaxID=2893586 RepID=UPI0004AA90FE|nr:glycosyltransferase family 1 protein [Actinoalloteichus caeruleus]
MPLLVVLTEQLLAPVPGGTGRYTRELAAALAGTAPPGWDVAGVVAKHADPDAAVIPGLIGPKSLPYPRRVLSALWERGIPVWPGGDSVHAPTPFAPPSVPRGRGLVVTVHDTVPWTHPETLTRRGAAWHRRMVGRAARRASALVTPTAAVAAELARHLDADRQRSGAGTNGATGPRTHVVGEGVSDALRRPLTDEFQQRVGRKLRLPDRYVLAVGTVEPRKGIDVLIRAMAGARGPDLPLVLVGASGWGGVDPRRLAEEHGLARDRLRVLGRIEDTELSAVLRQATVLAAPSRAEGFGLPVLEAMAVGVPVVHTDVPALVEVAGGAGLVVRRGDPDTLAGALRAVASDSGRAQAMIRAGLRRAEHYDWERAARALWRIHLDAVG